MENEVIILPNEDFMNLPIEYKWTEEDIASEFKKVRNKKYVADIYLIPVSEVTKILKRNNVL